MGWIMLLFAAAAVFAGVAAVRAARGRRRWGASPTDRGRSGADRADRPHRHVAHYHASGALPRWDP